MATSCGVFDGVGTNVVSLRVAIPVRVAVPGLHLRILQREAVLPVQDDFVLDWENSFAFKDPEMKAGYTHRTGMATRKDTTFVPTPSKTPQEVAMIEEFAELAASGNAARRADSAHASLKTQEYLDALWVAASS